MNTNPKNKEIQFIINLKDGGIGENTKNALFTSLKPLSDLHELMNVEV